MSFSRMEILQQIWDEIELLPGTSQSDLPESVITRYQAQLDKLRSVAEVPDTFCVTDGDRHPSRFVQDSFYGTVSYYTGPLTGREPMVVGREVFLQRREMALRFLRRLIHQEQAAVSSPKSNQDIVEQRKEILATFLRAYQMDQKDFAIADFGHEGMVIDHEWIPPGFNPGMSHIRALADMGQLILEPGSRKNEWLVRIAPGVFENVLGGQQGILVNRASNPVQAIKESPAITNIFNGPVGNLAQNSSNVRQTATIGVSSDEVSRLLETLRGIGLSDEGVSQLHDAMEADYRELGEYRAGPKVSQVLSSVLIGAGGNLLAAGFERAGPDIVREILAILPSA